jgi:polyphenol oxidase
MPIQSTVVPVVISPLFRDVRHGFSTRHGGVSSAPYNALNLGMTTADSPHNVLENRRRFAATLGVDWAAIVPAKLTHGCAVSVFAASEQSGESRERPKSPTPVPPVNFDSDAVVSDVPGLHFFMTFADCVPLLFWDSRRRVIGAAHAGWRGTALNIAERVVTTMQERFGSSPLDIVACAGPSIGPCCYTVGDEVCAAFARNRNVAVLGESANGRTLDLWETNRRQLETCGVPGTAIDVMGLCTSCNDGDYFSHRRQHGVTGRMGIIIGMDAATV